MIFYWVVVKVPGIIFRPENEFLRIRKLFHLTVSVWSLFENCANLNSQEVSLNASSANQLIPHTHKRRFAIDLSRKLVCQPAVFFDRPLQRNTIDLKTPKPDLSGWRIYGETANAF